MTGTVIDLNAYRELRRTATGYYRDQAWALLQTNRKWTARDRRFLRIMCGNGVQQAGDRQRLDALKRQLVFGARLAT